MQDNPSAHGSPSAGGGGSGANDAVVVGTTASTLLAAHTNVSSKRSQSPIEQMKKAAVDNSRLHLQSGKYDVAQQKPAAGCGELPITKVNITSPTDKEIVRLIGQHLRDLGLHMTVDTLIQESGCEMEHPAAARFRQHVLQGKWDSMESDLKALMPFVENPEKLKEMKFMILEQKYLECLEEGLPVEALRVLREELSPLKYFTERLHQLSGFLMCSTVQELRNESQWPGCGPKSRQNLVDRLQAFLPTTVMLPPRRLEQLLLQAVELQHNKCTYHNTNYSTSLSVPALLNDHQCDADLFPTTTYQILSDHRDEVWYCQFSNNGLYLATGSKESIVIVWEVDQVTKRWYKRYTFDGHNLGTALLSWSPNDQFLGVVGQEEGPDLWIWNVETGELHHRMSHSPDDSLSCIAWYPDSKRFVCGGMKGQFYSCDLDGNVHSAWEGVRIRHLWCCKDGKTVLAADSHNRIRSYQFDEMIDRTLIKEENPLIHFCLDRSEKFVLCNLASQGIHVWDLENFTLVRRYRGCQQANFTIYSCFGGILEQFLASGSEDFKVCVWHRRDESPILKLSGHSNIVNCVSWNPKDPSILASASDDGTIRLWGPSHFASRKNSIDFGESCEVSSTTSGNSSATDRPIET